MLFARSPEECHLYLELHPCECGEAVFGWSRHRKEQRGDRMASVYEGVCGEFLAVGEDLATAVAPDPATLDPAALDDAYEAIEMAVAALDEVLKFVPAGADGVPLDAFEYRTIRSAYETAVG